MLMKVFGLKINKGNKLLTAPKRPRIGETSHIQCVWRNGSTHFTASHIEDTSRKEQKKKVEAAEMLISQSLLTSCPLLGTK